MSSESSESAESSEESSGESEESSSETLASVRAKARYDKQMLRGCEPHRGDTVEVYWEGDKAWYTGEVVESDDDSFDVKYDLDGAILLHSRTDGIYQYRLVKKWSIVLSLVYFTP